MGSKENAQELLQNIEKLHTTELGLERIRKNIDLHEPDIIAWCKEQIANKAARTYRQGKNWYIEVNGNKLTVNAKSYTVITAHKIDPM